MRNPLLARLASLLAVIATAAGVLVASLATAGPAHASISYTTVQIAYANDFFKSTSTPCFAPDSEINGAVVRQSPCPVNAADAHWRRVWDPETSNTFTLQWWSSSSTDRYCLDTKNAQTIDGTTIVIGRCRGNASDGAATQHWYFDFDDSNRMVNVAKKTECFTGMADTGIDAIQPCSSVAVNQRIHALASATLSHSAYCGSENYMVWASFHRSDSNWGANYEQSTCTGGPTTVFLMPGSYFVSYAKPVCTPWFWIHWASSKFDNDGITSESAFQTSLGTGGCADTNSVIFVAVRAGNNGARLSATYTFNLSTSY